MRPSHKLCSKPVMISAKSMKKQKSRAAALESQAWGPILPQFCLNPGLVSGGRLWAPRLPRAPRCSIRMPLGWDWLGFHLHFQARYADSRSLP